MPKSDKKSITADKLGLAESMVSAGKKRRGRPKKFQTLAEVEADINLREFQKSQEKLKKEKEKNKALKFLTKRVENNETKITKLKNILKLRRENEKKNKDNVDIKPDEDKKDEVKDFLLNVIQPSLTKIEENLSKILGNFDKQIETDKDKQDDLRVSEELGSEKAREEKLEKPKEKGGKVYSRVFHRIQQNNDIGRQVLESDVKSPQFKNFSLNLNLYPTTSLIKDSNKITSDGLSISGYPLSNL